MKYVLDQLLQASTWRGIVYLVTALGVTLSPAQSAAIIAFGLALAGAISVFLPDSLKKDGP